MVQRGTHDELYRAGGLYRRLHDLQFREDDVMEIADRRL
jgi:ABC-type multidrug transport system fused ATPase/permease subunit